MLYIWFLSFNTFSPQKISFNLSFSEFKFSWNTYKQDGNFLENIFFLKYFLIQYILFILFTAYMVKYRCYTVLSLIPYFVKLSKSFQNRK